jgi:hypothetical protein
MHRGAPSGPLLLLCIACESTTAPLALTADLTSGASAAGAFVPYPLLDRTADTLFAAACCDRPLVLAERRVGPRWEGFTSDACLAICMTTPVGVPPRGSLADGIRIAASGTFRLRVTVFRTWRADSPVTVTSPAFTVRW